MPKPSSEPEYCNLAQALLWVHEGKEPIAEGDFESLLPPQLPTDAAPRDALILALRGREIHGRGTLVHMVEDVLSERELTPSRFLGDCDLESGAADVHEPGVGLKSKVVAQRLVCRLDDQFTPAPDEWTSQNINWRESYLDLGGLVEQDLPHSLDLKQCARQWQRVIFIQVRVSDLRATFPQPHACSAAPKDGGGPSRTGRGGRPAHYDWVAFNSELEEVIRRGRSLSQADLERIMEQWCSHVWGKTPSHSVLAARIRSTWLKFRETTGDFGDFSGPGFASLSIHWGGSVQSTLMQGRRCELTPKHPALRRAKLTVHH
jgi:hypothetical protein